MISSKKAKMFLLIFGIIIIGAVVIYGAGLLKTREPIQNQFMMQCKHFAAKNPTLDFTFEYPKTGWTPFESSGRSEKYDRVSLRGPMDKKTKFTTIIFTTVRPLKAGKTASDLLKDYLAVDSNLSKFEASHEQAMNVGGEKAFSAFSKYEAIPSYDLRVPRALFKKQMVFVVRNGHSYEFELNTFASKFDAYAQVLKHVLETFRFKK